MCDKSDLADSIGYAGGVILSICLIPQIIKIYKTKQVENISYYWQFLYLLGISLHLYYGIHYNLLPIYIPTILELFLVLLLLYLTYIYSRERQTNRLDI